LNERDSANRAAALTVYGYRRAPAVR